MRSELDSFAPFGDGPQATAAAVAHLGYVQIDTINVIERCHHHILWNRIPGYRRADLRTGPERRQKRVRILDACAVLCADADLRFFLPAMKRHRSEGHKWYGEVSKADLRKVLTLIRKDGALTIRDIDDDVLVDKEHLWASRKPSKRALQLAFYTGVLTISARAGMLKTYELTARHFGWDKPPKPASATEVSDYLLDRALRAQGVVSLDSICHLDAPSKAAIRRLIEKRVRHGELVPVALEGAGKQEHWAKAETLASDGERFGTGAHPLAVRSPDHPAQADPSVLRLRASLRGLCAEGEAAFGYFALPVLAGEDIVAALDLKTDRKQRQIADAEMELGRHGARRTPVRI